MTGLEDRRRRWKEEDLYTRLWAGDPTVWGPSGTPELADRLGWLRLHETMRPRLPELSGIAASILDEGPTDVVLLGMGGSSLAPEVFATVLGGGAAYPRLAVLDSTHPDQVWSVSSGIDHRSTVFVASSKSGTTLETISALQLFWEQTGRDGSRFVAITDPGTPLVAMAEEGGFRALVMAPPDVGGRFSALSPFGLLPAALVGADLEALLDAAASLHHETAVDQGLEWGEAARQGVDKLTLSTSPALASFPWWMEQLVAESLGKDGKGIIPVAGEPSLESYGEDRLFVTYRLRGELVAVSPAGHPAIEVEVSDRIHLAAAMLQAEVATAAAGAVLGVHPFDQPDVERAKKLARQALSAEPARVDAIDSFHPALTDRLDDLVASVNTGDYFCLQAFLPRSEEVDAALASIRRRVGNQTWAATTAGYGPRFLHSTGQLHKGGPNTGVFLQLVDRPVRDMPVPGSDITFGRIIAAQALGDYAAMREKGRRVLRVDLGEDRAAGLARLLEALA
jgi:transaldolase/glucose-6-phosphate isomerase